MSVSQTGAVGGGFFTTMISKLRLVIVITIATVKEISQKKPTLIIRLCEMRHREHQTLMEMEQFVHEIIVFSGCLLK